MTYSQDTPSGRTGSFIGSHFTVRLFHLSGEVVAFVHYNSRGDCGHLGRIESAAQWRLYIISGGLRDPHALMQARST